MTPTILIVDDSPAIHQLVASHFEREPWHICSAYTGTEGLAMAATRGAEVVLLDVDLPDMNGFEVCRHLGEEAPDAAVIFLTASASVDEKVCGLHLGGVDYVTKPFEAAELVERVRNSLRTKRLLDLVPVPARGDHPSGTTADTAHQPRAHKDTAGQAAPEGRCGGRWHHRASRAA
jgi:DNA-binding response OmpR family regulator